MDRINNPNRMYCFILGVFLLLSMGLKAQPAGGMNPLLFISATADCNAGFFKSSGGDDGGLDDQDGAENNNAANDAAPINDGVVILIAIIAAYGGYLAYKIKRNKGLDIELK